MTDNNERVQAQVSELEARVRGRVIRPLDAEYDAARKVYNGMIDRRPQLIVRCHDTADVVAAVNFARDHELPLAVRGGGHNVAGFATCDDGLVIDLGPMKGTWVDAGARRARVQGGCTWGDVDHATHVFGLATPGGLISTTGVAGLTLGGASVT
ncbi:MAG: FAD-dependent oxidoreductase [Caldilineaceae bacterium]